MSRLREDTSGAIMVMGLFMAIFLVAILYYLIGIGEALYYRERMQDAADSAAFASAAIHARGMNFIALCNIIMAVLVAIMLGIGLLKNIFKKVMLIASAMFLVPGALGVASAAGGLYELAEGWYNTASAIITPILPVIRFVADGIKITFPLAGSAQAVAVAFDKYNPPAKAGVVWPIIKNLPVEDDDFKVTCDHANGYLKDVVLFPVPGGLFKDIVGIAYEALKALANAGAETYCDESSGSPKPVYQEEKRAVPPMGPKNDKCQAEEEMGVEARKAICEDALDEAQKAESIDEQTGDCKTDECRARREKAAEQCDYRKNDHLHHFIWQEQIFVRTIRKTKLQGVIDETVAEGSPEIHKQEEGYGIPCEIEPENRFPKMFGQTAVSEKEITPAELRSSENDITRIRLPWTRPKETESEYKSDVVEAHVCHQSYKLPPKQNLGKDPIVIRYRAVTSVVGCLETFTKAYKFDKKVTADPEGESRSPKRMVKDTILGEEMFQIRSFVLGHGLSQFPDKIVKLATWKQRASPVFGEAHKVLDLMKDGSVAQAEFYYDDPGENAEWVNASGDNTEWTWHMYWKARFRRFRVSMDNPQNGQCVPDQGGGGGGLCGGGSGGGDGPIGKIVGVINEIVMH